MLINPAETKSLIELKSPEFIRDHNSQDMIRACKALLEAIPRNDSPEGLLLYLDPYLPSVCSVSLQSRPVELLLQRDDEIEEIPQFYFEVKYKDELIAELSMYLQPLDENKIFSTMTILVGKKYKNLGIGSAFLAINTMVLADLSQRFPQFLGKKIISYYEDAETTEWVDSQNPLLKSWGDKELSRLGYTFDPEKIKEIVPFHSIEGLDPNLSPYQSRVKVISDRP